VLLNTTKAKLAAGEAVFGCFFRYAEPSLAEYVAMQGWDFLVFDGEHGTLEPRDLEDLCRALELRGVTPITRVAANRPENILRSLDTGVHGVHVPWVNSPGAVEEAVRAVKYHPRGMRGLAGTRSSEWGLREPLEAYVERADRETLVVIHIETRAAVEAVEDYVGIDGVDVLFLGPTDLSQSLGHPGRPDHPEVQAAMDRVAEVVVPSAKVLGIYAGTAAMTEAWLERGARYFTTGVEMFLRDGMTAHLGRVRGWRR
jgi:4-hydroxy-2-oxoheptanedioate aldolase